MRRLYFSAIRAAALGVAGGLLVYGALYIGNYFSNKDNYDTPPAPHFEESKLLDEVISENPELKDWNRRLKQGELERKVSKELAKKIKVTYIREDTLP